MAIIKLILEKDEKINEVEENLIKAIQSRSELAHEGEEFTDPVLREIEKKFNRDYQVILKQMQDEIEEELKEEQKW